MNYLFLSYKSVLLIVFNASLGKCFNITSEYWYILHGENVGGSSLSIPYFVITISFNQFPKKLFTVIILLSMLASLFVFFFLFIEKQI